VKFSVLLPTRNRLELLRLAVETVRAQDYDDWEIIVSDNASADDVCGYVRDLGDPRIRCSRTDFPVRVTDNWNRALDLSTGDYIVMLGDDDALMPGYFRLNKEAIESFAQPELIFVQGVQFVYAGVMPGHANSFVQVAHCGFLHREKVPFLLPADAGRDAVCKSARFSVSFPYNMQYWLFSRSFVARFREKGPFFQSPYPDYYAANSALLEARRILVQPMPLVAVGISPKSFGYYYFNKRESDGVKFLQPSSSSPDPSLAKVLVPGSDMNDSWLLAMETMRRNWGRAHGIKVGAWRYRFLQLRKAYVERNSFREFLRVLRKHATAWESVLWVGLHIVICLRSFGRNAAVKAIKRELTLDIVHCAYPKVKIYVAEVDAKDILELHRRFSPAEFLKRCHASLGD
jgi:glycosyltransferase involved in cell wall biosynthesis